MGVSDIKNLHKDEKQRLIENRKTNYKMRIRNIRNIKSITKFFFLKN